MPKYLLTLGQTRTATQVVEARDEEQARAMAEKLVAFGDAFDVAEDADVEFTTDVVLTNKHHVDYEQADVDDWLADEWVED